MELGESIKNLRKKRELKQFELAKSCGISQTYLSQIENDKKIPSLGILELIGKHLNIPPEIILFISIDFNSVPENKREIFKKVYPSIKALVTEYFME